MYRRFLLLILLSLFLPLSCQHSELDQQIPPAEPSSAPAPMMHLLDPAAEVRGVWIATVFDIDFPSRPDLSPDELMSELDAILDTAGENGLNTVVFQVRPTGDALYDSDLFPVSEWLFTDGVLSFDPLAYLVEEAHQRNIRIDAWVNPLRLSVREGTIDDLPEGSPGRDHPDWVTAYADGRLYLNAGIPEVRQLVADGIAEIVKNYNVDGVIFDDYFYPYPVAGEDGMTVPFDDDAAYEAYGNGLDVPDWRRSNVNELIRLCHDVVKAEDPRLQFGVAPGGIWRNNDGQNGGSDTLYGFESYTYLYCDALEWVRSGTVDYLAPQIYWQFETQYTPYDVVLRWWNAQLDGSGVKLYVSHAAYRYEEGDWADPTDEMAEQVNFARSELTYTGSLFYGYDEVNRNIRGIADELKRTFADEILYTSAISTDLPLVLSTPADGTVMASDHTWVSGSSDPYYPLTLDGVPVSRTKSGYFNLYLELKEGENVFTFTQNGIDTEYRLTYDPNQNWTLAPAEPTILVSPVPTGLYPASDTAIQGDGMWVSAMAPYGSSVTVALGGRTTALEPLEVPSVYYADSGYVGISYGATLSLPEAGNGEILDLGSLLFTVSLGDGVYTAEGGRIRILGEDAALTVRTTRDYAHLKIAPDSSYYDDYTVQSAGMTEAAVSLLNGFYRLRMGGYLSVSEAEELPEEAPGLSQIDSVKVIDAGENTEIRIETTGRPPYNACIEEDSGQFVLTLYSVEADRAPEPVTEWNPILNGGHAEPLGDKVRYVFDPVDVMNFYGFDLEYRESEVVVTLRNPKRAADGEKPLDGFSVSLDAGHGGWEIGASGPDPSIPEKDLNRAVVRETARQLAELGADVQLIRPEDEVVLLEDRVKWLEEHPVDLSVSIHQNSMDYSVDVTRIRGTVAFWCMDDGRLLSDCVGRAAARSLGRLYRGSSWTMLALCRNPKIPSALVELGFITCAEEYEQLTSETGVRRAADGVVSGILDYVGKMGLYLDRYEEGRQG